MATIDEAFGDARRGLRDCHQLYLAGRITEAHDAARALHDRVCSDLECLRFGMAETDFKTLRRYEVLRQYAREVDRLARQLADHR